MAICPFLSNVIVDTSSCKIEPLGSHTIPTSFGGDMNIVEIQHPIYWYEVHCPSNGNCKFWDTIVNECTFPILNHIHRNHIHCNLHNCPDIPNTCGYPTGCYGGGSIAIAANVLMNEYLTSHDLDGNNKIYGLDFACDLISEPPLLKTLRLNPNWKTPNTVVSYESIQNWYNGGNDPLSDL